MEAKQIKPTIHQALFVKLAELLQINWGIFVKYSDKNVRILEGKLFPILVESNLNNFTELYELIKASEIDSEFAKKVATAVTVNTTQFFREPEHFKHLERFAINVWQLRCQQVAGEVRIWCAASSTGQEAYTLAMLLLELDAKMKFRILSTDIDIKALEYAARGTYSEMEVNTVPSYLLKKYFDKSSLSPVYKLKDQVVQHVQFAPFNLVTEKYPFKHKFDFIFCRNVFIYFEEKTITDVVEKMSSQLLSKGHLFVGHTESRLVQNRKLKYVVPSIFERVT